MKRVVFLDIDGVLNSNFWNTTHSKEISDGTLVDDEKIKLLAQIITSTSAQMILHSGWRFWFHDEMKPLTHEASNLTEILAAHGLRIDGKTPDLTTPEIRITKKFSRVKADEILLWLEENPDTEGWVVLDDLDLGNAAISSHQVKTDSSTGLTESDVCKAKEIYSR